MRPMADLDAHAVRHRAPAGSRRHDAAEPAHRGRAHVVRARHRAHAPGRRRCRSSRSSASRPTCCCCVAIAAGLAAGPERGAVVGFAAGLAFDLLLQTPFGLSALTYALVGYLVGRLQDSVLRAAWWIPVATAAAASAVGVILFAVLGTVVGEDLVGCGSSCGSALVVAVLNRRAPPLVVRAVRHALGRRAARADR